MVFQGHARILGAETWVIEVPHLHAPAALWQSVADDGNALSGSGSECSFHIPRIAEPPAQWLADGAEGAAGDERAALCASGEPELAD